MKRTTLLLSLCLGLLAATGCTKKTDAAQADAAPAAKESPASASQPAAQSVYITQQDLRARLFDYTAPEYRYLASRPCVIDIYATWCGPCKQLAPVLDELASEFAGQVDFYKFDGEKETEAASAIGVRAYPTLLLLAPGKEPVLQVGALPKDMLKQLITEKLMQ